MEAIVTCMLQYSLGLFLIAVVVGLALGRGKLALYIGSILTAIASTLILLTVVFSSLIGLIDGTLNLHSMLPLINVPIRIDWLALVLLLIISLLGIATSVYTPRYMECYSELGREGYFIAAFSAFIASMVLVVLSNDMLWFLFMWEVMTFTSYLLIVWEYSENYVVRAGWKYFVSMHFLSTLPLIVGIVYLWGITGTTLIDAASAKTSGITLADLVVLYTLFIIGFAAKAGIVPLHFWLPDAHPAAPSNVSALLSGVMIKVAVYGMLRFCCYVLPVNTVLGYVIASLGTLSLTIGTLYALKQTDAKRLLAYHSVGQMGYIWLGLGAGIALLSQGNPLGCLGIIAGLYHLVNHAVFKGLLFLSAGSILYRAHTRDLNIVGGLGKIMPITSVFTLIAALSIAGIPPFNGFMSKWLIYETTFSSMNGLLVFFGVLALFISAATLASFIKFYTTAFTGDLKVNVREKKEVPTSMLIGMGILALTCIILGVLPITIVPLLNAVASSLSTITLEASIIGASPMGLEVASSVFSPIVLLFFIGLVLGLTALIVAPKTAVKASPWDTGIGLDEYKSFKLTAKHYYLTYEEALHTLYSLGEKSYEIASKGITEFTALLLRINYNISTSLSKLALHARSIGQIIVKNAREVYFDEAVVGPLIHILRELARFLGWTVLRTDMNTYLVYSALYVVMLSLIVLVFVGFMTP